VEKIVPPTLKTMENKNGMTPTEIFYKEHKESSEKAVTEVNGTANTFLVVAALFITLSITAALSIRNNKISENTHFLHYKKWFKLFILSLGYGVSFCATSMLLLNSIILPSTWTQKRGYLNSRLSRMTLGYLSLYSSFLVLVIITIFSGAILVYSFFPNWVFYVIDLLYAIPITLIFFISIYPLYFCLVLKLAFYTRRVTMIMSKW